MTCCFHFAGTKCAWFALKSTQFLTSAWLIWTFSLYVVCSQIYWLNFWPWHGWYRLSGRALFTAYSISDAAWLIRNLSLCIISFQIRPPGLLTLPWSIWTLSLWVVASKSTHLIPYPNIVDLNFQVVRSWFSNLLTQFLTLIQLIWTLSVWVVYSQIYSLDFWP